MSIKIKQAQFEEEVGRLREEIQKRETALQKAQSRGDIHAQQLSEALRLLNKQKSRVQEHKCVQPDDEGKWNKDNEANSPLSGSQQSLVLYKHALLYVHVDP